MVIIIIGNQGTGKSFFIKKYIQRAGKSYNFYGYHNCGTIEDSAIEPETIYIYDDSGEYITHSPNAPISRKLISIISARRHAGINIICAFHTARQVPIWLKNYANHFVIFNQPELFGVEKYDEVVNRVNEKNSELPEDKRYYFETVKR